MTKRRANGEGSISRDANGIYHCYMQTDVINDSGNYVRVHGQGISEAEAQKNARKKKANKERARDISADTNFGFSKRETYGSYMEDFMLDKLEHGYKGKIITESTYGSYMNDLRACFFNHKISRLQPKQLLISDFRDYYAYLDSRYPNNLHRRKQVRGFCINCLLWLNQKGFNLNIEIATIPQIKLPQVDAIDETKVKEFRDMMFASDDEKQCLTEEELKALELAHSDRACKYTACFLLQTCLGLRVGELLALQDSDLDREKRILYVYKAIGRRLKNKDKTTREIYLKCTKNADKRIVFVDDYTLSIWDWQVEQTKRMAKSNPKNLLICAWDSGNYVKPDSYNESLKRMAHNYGISLPSKHCSHILRKTYATYNSLTISVNPLLLSKATGHHDVDILLNTYVKPTIQQLSTIQSPYKILESKYSKAQEETAANALNYDDMDDED